MLNEYYQTDTLKKLPYSSMCVDFPVNMVGKWSEEAIRVPLALHDCGCGIVVMMFKQHPTRDQLKRIEKVYDHQYIDVHLAKQLPSQSQQWCLFGPWKCFAKHLSDDDHDQKTAVYYCAQTNQYAMRYHYSDHYSCDPVLAYSIARIGLGARGRDYNNVKQWCRVLQQYSINARLKYAEMIADIIDIDDIIDIPHVMLDDDDYYRFGTQRGKITIQTTRNHIWLFESNQNNDGQWMVGSLPYSPDALDDPNFFEDFCKHTSHLAHVYLTFKRCILP